VKNILRIIVVVSVLVVGIVATTSIASAAFLCPVVGDGVNTADVANGDHGVSTINPAVGTSFFPGFDKNQAGAKANPNAYNTDGPGNPDAGPGGNPNFSPIWP
jgi:hypothetical protein